MSKVNDRGWVALLLWYLPVVAVQLIAGTITATSITPWYRALEKAPWTPAAWLFGPVWTVLYIMMACAVWLLHQTAAPQRHWAYTLFFAQLFFNGLWSFLFFYFHLIGWALIDLGLLVGLIAMTITTFFRIRPLSGLLLLPYFLWSLYAFSLNAAIWWLNS